MEEEVCLFLMLWGGTCICGGTYPHFIHRILLFLLISFISITHIHMWLVCVDCECLITRSCTHAVSANVQTKMASNFKKLFAPDDWSLKDD